MSQYNVYLSYSGRKSYIDCPKLYQYRYILKTKVEIDRSSSFFGSMIGKVFEWFYEEDIWSCQNPVFSSVSLIPRAIQFVLSDNGVIDQEINNIKFDLNKFVQSGVSIIRSEGLLSQNSKAELDLTTNYFSEKHNLTIRLGGRADFVHYFSDDEIWLLDGKGSSYREKYVDSEQLVWYSVQHYIKYGVAPSRIGFIYWRFPDDPIQWVEYNNQSIRDSIDKTFNIAKRIILKLFDPKPSSNCRLCDYSSLCNEGGQYLLEHRVEVDNKIESSIFDLDMI